MKYKIIVLVIISIGIGILVFMVIKNQKTIRTDVIGNEKTIHVSNIVAVDPRMVSVAEDSFLYSIIGAYPQFIQADQSFNEKISNVFTNHINDFKKSADENYQDHLKIEGEAFKAEFEKGDRGYNFSISTSVIQSNDAFISVIVREEGYTGGAHPFHTVLTFNYDVKNHKELSLTDFITLKEVSDISRKDLRDQFTKKGDAGTFEMFAIDGTDPLRPENFQNFTVTPSAVVIYFNEYQVAPYVYGEMSVMIPRK